MSECSSCNKVRKDPYFAALRRKQYEERKSRQNNTGNQFKNNPKYKKK